VNHSPQKKQVRKCLETTLILHVTTLAVGQVLEDAMEALDVLDDRVAWSYAVISGGFDVANGEFIEGVPVDLPEDGCHDDDS
jgi:hypothetical protein